MKTLLSLLVLCTSLVPVWLRAQNVPPAAAGQVPPPNSAQPLPANVRPVVATPATNSTSVRTNRLGVPRQFPRPASPGATQLTPPAPGTGPVVVPGGATPPGGANQPNFNAAVANAVDGGTDGSSTNVDLSIKAQRWKNMPLDQFLDVYAKVSKRTVLRGSGLPLQTPITLEPVSSLTEEETKQAYDTVLALNNITMIPTGEKFVVAVPQAQANQQGAAFGKRGVGDLPEASQFITQILQLKHLKPSEAVQVITQFTQNPSGIVAIDTTMTLVLRDYAINMKRMLEVLEKIDVEPVDEYVLEVIPIKYGRVEDIYQSMNGIIGGGGGGVASGAATAAQGMRGGRGGFGSRGGSGGYGGYGGGSGSGYGGYNSGSYRGGGYSPYSSGVERIDEAVNELNSFAPLQTAATPTRTVTPTISQPTTFQGRLNTANRLGQGQANQENQLVSPDAKIQADMRSNSLIVYANKRDMERIKKVVEKVDTMLAQVLIESIIMEVSLGDTLNYGVDARQRRKQFTDDVAGGGLMNNTKGLENILGVTNVVGDGNLNANGFSYLLQLGQNWDVLITAAATDSRVNIIQRPRILTSHATEGSFFVGSEVPFVNGTSAGGVYGNSSYYQREQVGVGLHVMPYITPDGLVVMEINQEIASLGKPIKIDANDVPTTQTRNATSTVTVRDKDAILIGGYITSSDTRANAGVPILKDLPLLGMLFRSSSKSHDRTEMMVLMRPTILPTPADAAKMADQERQRLPGVRVAEKTSEHYEQLEQLKADAEVKKLDDEQQKRLEKANKKAKKSGGKEPIPTQAEPMLPPPETIPAPAPAPETPPPTDTQ